MLTIAEQYDRMPSKHRCEAMTKRPKRVKAKTARQRKSPAGRPRTFEEVVAANLRSPELWRDQGLLAIRAVGGRG
jgi:hypothetical protein